MGFLIFTIVILGLCVFAFVKFRLAGELSEFVRKSSFYDAAELLAGAASAVLFILLIAGLVWMLAWDLNGDVVFALLFSWIESSSFWLFCFAASGVSPSRQSDNDRQERSGMPAGKRRRGFYAVVIPALAIGPAAALWACSWDIWYPFLKTFLLAFPVGLILSSAIVDIAVMASNRRHNIGMSDRWSRFAMLYSVIVPFLYAPCHAAAFAMDTEHHYSNALISIDPTIMDITFLILQIVVLYLTYLILPHIHKRIGGYEVNVSTLSSDFDTEYPQNNNLEIAASFLGHLMAAREIGKIFKDGDRSF